MTPTCPPADGSAAKTQRFDGAPPMCLDLSKRYGAVMTTSMGAMTIAFDAIAAPRTVNNFVFLARYHYYEDTFFHRVIPGFVLQGGDPTGTGTGGPGYRFEDELPAPGRYEIGSLAMANAGPNTNGSQFFITTVVTPWLDGKHVVFGEVVDGMDLVQKIEGLGSRSGTPQAQVQIQDCGQL